MNRTLIVFGKSKILSGYFVRNIELILQRKVYIVSTSYNGRDDDIIPVFVNDFERKTPFYYYRHIPDYSVENTTIDYKEENIPFVDVISLSEFKRRFQNTPDLLIISACRNGLIDTYVPILIEMKCGGLIVSFDNDENLSKRAAEQLERFVVRKGVVHQFVSGEVKNRKEIVLQTSSDVLFLFPAEAKEYFDRVYLPFWMRIVSDEAQMKLLVFAKSLYINIPHTILIVMCVKMNYSDEWRDKKIIDYLSEECINEYIIHSRAVQEKLRDRIPEDDRLAWETLFEGMVSYFQQNTTETFGRGLGTDINSKEKFCRHKKIVEETGLNDLIEEFRLFDSTCKWK